MMADMGGLALCHIAPARSVMFETKGGTTADALGQIPPRACRMSLA